MFTRLLSFLSLVIFFCYHLLALHHLPNELIEHTAYFLVPDEIIYLGLTNRDFNQLLDCESFYKRYLQKNGIQLDTLNANNGSWKFYFLLIKKSQIDIKKGGIDFAFVANRPIWPCQEFFRQEKKRPGGDADLNLFANKGALWKYDQATGSNLLENEKKKSIAFGVDEHVYGWWSNGSQAALASCLLPRPRHDIWYNDIFFTIRDVEGLLTYFLEEYTFAPNCIGTRNFGDDTHDFISPQEFLEAIQGWADDDTAFVMDLGIGAKVKNVPFDNLIIQRHNELLNNIEAKNSLENQPRNCFTIVAWGDNFANEILVLEIHNAQWHLPGCSHLPPDLIWQPKNSCILKYTMEQIHSLPKNNFLELIQKDFPQFSEIYFASIDDT